MIENLITHSDPQIVHAPGFDHAKPKIWYDILNFYLKMKPKNYIINSELAIVTWNNVADSILEKSLRHNGVKYYKIGGNIVKWNNLIKFEILVDFLKNIEVEYVIGLDSFDVVFFGDPNICLERFLGFNLDLVFNAEVDFYPNWDVSYFKKCKTYQRNKFPGKFCYLNSGVWMGRKNFCIDFFSECSKIKLWDKLEEEKCPLIRNCDQSVVHGVFSKYENAGIDYNCSIMQNLAHIDKEVVFTSLL